MYLVRLIYASRAKKDFDSKDIEEIMATSIKNNDRDDITGLLCFNHRVFLQCLEGSREKVNQTYTRICNDKRHEDMVILNYSEIYQRDYPDWSMGLHLDNKIRREINLEYSMNSIFDPFSFNGESARLFLKAIKEFIKK